MKDTSISPSKKNDGLHRYLKPGALARLRDSKINARSRKTNSLMTLSLLQLVDSSLNHDRVQIPNQMSIFGDIPDFFNKIYGPYCMQRKKLMAVKSVPFFNLNPSSPALEPRVNTITTTNNNSALISVLNNDLLAAH